MERTQHLTALKPREGQGLRQNRGSPDRCSENLGRRTACQEGTKSQQHSSRGSRKRRLLPALGHVCRRAGPCTGVVDNLLGCLRTCACVAHACVKSCMLGMHHMNGMCSCKARSIHNIKGLRNLEFLFFKPFKSLHKSTRSISWVCARFVLVGFQHNERPAFQKPGLGRSTVWRIKFPESSMKFEFDKLSARTNGVK